MSASTRSLISLVLVASALAAGIAFATTASAAAQVNNAVGCAYRYGFAQNPVPVAKSVDGQQVLATVQWGYSPGLCYLTLNADAVQALRANPPARPPQLTTANDKAAADRCHNAYSHQHGFAQNPVTVAKSVDGQEVLAIVQWGYSPGLCYLTLDNDAVQALRANPPPAPTTDDLPIPANPHSRIAASFWGFCYLRADNTAVCKGNERFYGTALTGAPGGEFASISSISIHACGLRTDGTLECWGDDRWWPYHAPDGRFAAVATGAWWTCGLRTSGAIECWGHKTEAGTLLNDERLDAPDGQFAAVSVSTSYACGLRTDGAVQCWGLDPYRYGTLESPTGRFSAISAGGRHACGLQADGTAACWGDNRVGQASPPSGRFTAVSAGYSHSCGLRVDETVECWGSNFHKQSDAPEGPFTEISAGGHLSCGLRPDQITVCWGEINHPFSGEIDVHVFHCTSRSAAYSDADLRREINELSANVGEFYREQSSSLVTLNFIPGGVVSPDSIQWNHHTVDEGHHCRSEISQLGNYPNSLVLVNLAPGHVSGFTIKSESEATAYSATLEARYSKACSRLNSTARVRDLDDNDSCSDYENYYRVIAHELGHALFSLKDTADCSIMSKTCEDSTTIGCVSALKLGWPYSEEDCFQEQHCNSHSPVPHICHVR